MRRRILRVQASALVPWVVLVAWQALGIAGGEPLTDVLSDLALITLWFVLDVGLGTGRAAGLPRWWRTFSAVLVAAVVLSDHPWLSPGALQPDDLWPWLLVLAVVAVLVWDARRGVPGPAVDLAWPLPAGPWLVGEGTTRLLNHHWPAPAQRAALDLVAVGGWWGRSYRGLVPRDAADLWADGAAVTSPCAGRVVLAVDGAPPWPAPGVHPYGNLVVLETGGETPVEVWLAHLQPGSIVVAQGDAVAVGDPIGWVGSSGSSTEPHLHVQATAGERPVPMRFTSVRGGYRRGSVLRAG